ncbi:MAG: hypothetical protein O2960_08550 [Verrucomicrobia bacterium]|nr:hypothetical protein [Verrucomicrobiota bacterium]
MMSTYPSGTPGLVAQFQFGDEGIGSNGSEAPDSSGNGHTMSLVNAALSPTPTVDVRQRARFVEEAVYVGQRLAPSSGEDASDANLAYQSCALLKTRTKSASFCRRRAAARVSDTICGNVKV